VAQLSHDDLARSIHPLHTMSDGDTLFARGTGQSCKTAGMLQLSTMAAEVTALAVVRAIMAAKGFAHGSMRWPSAREL